MSGILLQQYNVHCRCVCVSVCCVNEYIFGNITTLLERKSGVENCLTHRAENLAINKNEAAQYAALIPLKSMIAAIPLIAQDVSARRNDDYLPRHIIYDHI